eukprot:CAMPEP_0174252088 /NCGR_PEP_ID=MMETSP0439-20130205/1713_1 /TAXON_ID=0 /ORGANISM="Stereomyxa ramosa, Strain Chinc5" /LENGTH=300 /DNA_ID=CAMNT_0015332581 /DNA_START=34 /DNA_END=936 /DNA_ORIENTATION=+
MALVHCLLLLSLFVSFSFCYTPVVLMHGINDDAGSMEHAKELIESKLPGVYVRALEIGDGKFDSIFWSSNHQVKKMCSLLQDDKNLTGKKINLIGFSQGGILSRGYLEKCNDPPVKNFISWVAPQMGVFGVPEVGHIKYLNWTLDEIADLFIYDKFFQDLLSFAGYWRDPYDLKKYATHCTYLPLINNNPASGTPTDSYKKNILSLENFIMSYSSADDVLIPKETGWFGAYAADTTKVIIPLEQQQFYTEDWIGIKTLADTNRLIRFETNCSHPDYHSSCFDYFFNKNVMPYLSATDSEK